MWNIFKYVKVFGTDQISENSKQLLKLSFKKHSRYVFINSSTTYTLIHYMHTY